MTVPSRSLDRSRQDDVPHRLTRLHSVLVSLAAVALLALAADFRRLRRLKATYPYGYEDEALSKLLAASNSRALLNVLETRSDPNPATVGRAYASTGSDNDMRDGDTVQSLSEQIESAKLKLKANIAAIGSEDESEEKRAATTDTDKAKKQSPERERKDSTIEDARMAPVEKVATGGIQVPAEMESINKDVNGETIVAQAVPELAKDGHPETRREAPPQSETAVATKQHKNNQEGEIPNMNELVQTKQETLEEKEGSSSRPKLVWLATFPNSGTSYTMHLVQSVSKTVAATNYEGEVTTRPLPTVYEEHPAPYILQGYPYELPEKFVLVKTHCSGYMKPASSDYGMTSESFEQGCTSSRQGKRYPTEQVGKVVHIIRNPYDNIVSRFHYDFNAVEERARRGDQSAIQWTNDHPRAPNGFQRFCHDKDLVSIKGWNRVNISPDFRDQLSKTICHDEVVAYVQWHNRAFEMCQRLGIPSLIFHYEDYEDKFDETVTNLLDFLELSRQDEPKPFKSGHSYRQGYYTDQDRANVKALAKQQASEQTWNTISRYFD